MTERSISNQDIYDRITRLEADRDNQNKSIDADRETTNKAIMELSNDVKKLLNAFEQAKGAKWFLVTLVGLGASLSGLWAWVSTTMMHKP